MPHKMHSIWLDTPHITQQLAILACKKAALLKQEAELWQQIATLFDEAVKSAQPDPCPMAAAPRRTGEMQGQGLVRLNAILKVIPVSSATWWRGVKNGRFPAPVKLGHITAWRAEDIQKLISSVAVQ